MAAIWDPRAVLKVDPRGGSFTCVGTTKKGTRCGQQFFSGADLTDASQILDTMATFRPGSSKVRHSLKELACLTLCPRWHRKPGYSQVNSMVYKWKDAIEYYCTSVEHATTYDVSRSLFQPVSSRTIDARRAPTPSYADRSRNTTIEEFPLRRAPLPARGTLIEQTHSRSTSRRSSSQPIQPLVLPTPSTLETHSSTSLNTPLPQTRTSNSSSNLPTPPPSPILQTRLPDTASIAPTAEHSRPRRRETFNATASLAAAAPASTPNTPSNSTPASPPTPTASTPPPPTPCTRIHHVTRKPITDNCSICWEPICCADDAVWCRAQCGQNVHRGCFAEWKTESIRREVARRIALDQPRLRAEDRLGEVKCVFCRALWKWEWQD